MSQADLQGLFGEVKRQVMMLLNETADEFDAKNLSPEQRQTYNDFTGVFGKKVLDLNMEVE